MLSSDRTTILVGESGYTSESNRFRFTLAHETGHWYLHEALYSACEFETIEEWKEFVRGIPEKDRGWYEWHANSFAGLILVQEEPLAEGIERAAEKAAAVDFTIDFEQEAHCEYVADYVARQFQVSSQVILKRGNHDGFWEFR